MHYSTPTSRLNGLFTRFVVSFHKTQGQHRKDLLGSKKEACNSGADEERGSHRSLMETKRVRCKVSYQATCRSNTCPGDNLPQTICWCGRHVRGTSQLRWNSSPHSRSKQCNSHKGYNPPSSCHIIITIQHIWDCQPHICLHVKTLNLSHHKQD